MKKTLMIMLICITSVTVCFAAKTKTASKYYKKNKSFASEVSVSFIPYAFQRVEETNQKKTKVDSKYSFGGNLSYTAWKKNSHFFFGGEGGYVLAEGRDLKDYSNVLLLGKLGYQIMVGENIRWALGLEAGADIANTNSKSSLFGIFGLELLGDFKIAGNFSAVFAVDGFLAFSEKNSANYRNFLLTTNVGLGYTF